MSKPQRRPNRRVLVIGDVMLDSDIRLTANRLSGEGAPVARFVDPVYRPGGAGAVAMMAAGLGAEVHLFGVAGNDGAAQLLKQLLDGIDGCLLLCGGRKTTQKSRVFIDGTQAVRIDEESTEPVKGNDLARLISDLPRDVDVVLITDYAKGVVTPELMRAVRKLYVKRGVPVIVDPRADGEWQRYRDVACITPNRREYGTAIEKTVRVATLGIGSVVEKLDRYGLLIVFAPRWGRPKHFPATVPFSEVVDTCGAGDMVLAALGVFVANGASWERAAELANVAAGLKCRKQGAVPVSLAEIAAHVGVSAGMEKIAGTFVASTDPATVIPAWSY